MLWVSLLGTLDYTVSFCYCFFNSKINDQLDESVFFSGNTLACKDSASYSVIGDFQCYKGRKCVFRDSLGVNRLLYVNN